MGNYSGPPGGPGGPPGHPGGPPGHPGGPPHSGPRAPSPGPPSGSPGPAGAPYSRPATDIQKLQNSINAMEERGMQGDPRYSQARTLHQSLMAQQGQGGDRPEGGPPPGPYPYPPGGPPGGPGYPPGGERPPSNFQNPQLLQLRAQIMSYRMLARPQPLPPQIAMAVTGKREPVPPGAPRPGAGQGPPPPDSRSSGTPPPPPPTGAPGAPVPS